LRVQSCGWREDACDGDEDEETGGSRVSHTDLSGISLKDALNCGV